MVQVRQPRWWCSPNRGESERRREGEKFGRLKVGKKGTREGGKLELEEGLKKGRSDSPENRHLCRRPNVDSLREVETIAE